MAEHGSPPAREPSQGAKSSRPVPTRAESSRAKSLSARSSGVEAAREGAWREGSQGWNALSYLIGGALLGTGAGSLAVKVTGFTTFFPAGVLLGLALAGYVIWVRYAQA